MTRNGSVVTHKFTVEYRGYNIVCEAPQGISDDEAEAELRSLLAKDSSLKFVSKSWEPKPLVH